MEEDFIQRAMEYRARVSEGLGISPQVGGAEAEAGDGVGPPGKVQVGGD